ncbi:hypothetical protein SLE2022_313310 [Rubroshorea leprosula]
MCIEAPTLKKWVFSKNTFGMSIKVALALITIIKPMLWISPIFTDPTDMLKRIVVLVRIFMSELQRVFIELMLNSKRSCKKSTAQEEIATLFPTSVLNITTTFTPGTTIPYPL